MKLRFRQSGGFAGLIRGCEIDTDSLPQEEAASLHKLVNKSGILKGVKQSNPEARDLIGYEVIVETTEGVFQVAFDDLSVPKDAAGLLEFLQGKAQPRAPK
ncbi:MAG: protealysin inhibitor emfourin [Thermodesulfobacteriota bacterium]